MSSTRSSLPTAISAKSPSAMAREPGTPGDKAAAAGQAVSLGNLQIFLRERVADLTRALEVKASTDFHDWLVSALALAGEPCDLQLTTGPLLAFLAPALADGETPHAHSRLLGPPSFHHICHPAVMAKDMFYTLQLENADITLCLKGWPRSMRLWVGTCPTGAACSTVG